MQQFESELWEKVAGVSIKVRALGSSSQTGPTHSIQGRAVVPLQVLKPESAAQLEPSDIYQSLLTEYVCTVIVSLRWFEGIFVFLSLNFGVVQFQKYVYSYIPFIYLVEDV